MQRPADVAMGWSPRDARYAVVLLVQGATATESPAECPRYSDSYDAVFFTDPSGIALEFCYTSNLTH
ncbi:hypothetical protein QU481_07115 [Crenobacter sp. SG2303]|uniref:VOC domain-containing protein n=1 Tax=Crenobacter oryzisoli TaxID=3056844 RepID=A0ABT7XLJ7_9NEIS|nr:hypothetical protein [Crenobacter sp. SG2303]MDN0074661.1 hypothetical protein [Crenobacter sp. SG2303]